MKNQQLPPSDVRTSALKSTSMQTAQDPKGLEHGVQSLVAQDSPDDSQLGARQPDVTAGKSTR